MSQLGQTVSAMFKKQEMPKLPEVTRMPDTADPTVVAAGKRKMRQEQMASGRESTDLTTPAPSYSSKDLGL